MSFKIMLQTMQKATMYHQRKSQKRHKRTSAVLLFVLCVSSSMHGSYGLSNTDSRNVHKIHDRKSKKLRKQHRDLIQKLGAACCVIGAAGIIYWASASTIDLFENHR